MKRDIYQEMKYKYRKKSELEQLRLGEPTPQM